MAKLFLVLVATCATTLATTSMPTTNANGASLSAFLTNLKEGMTNLKEGLTNLKEGLTNLKERLTNLKEGSENILDMVQRFETEQSTQIDQSSMSLTYLSLLFLCI